MIEPDGYGFGHMVFCQDRRLAIDDRKMVITCCTTSEPTWLFRCISLSHGDEKTWSLLGSSDVS